MTGMYAPLYQAFLAQGLDHGGHGHAANPNARDLPLRHFDPVRVNLLPDNPRQVCPDHGRRHPLAPQHPGPVGKCRGVQDVDVFQLIERQLLGTPFTATYRAAAECRTAVRQMFGGTPLVEFLVMRGVDIDVHQKMPLPFCVPCLRPLCGLSLL